MKKNEKNIYTIIQEKSNYLFDKYDLSKYIVDKDNKSNIEKIVRQTFYELNLNICNQVIYDYTYNFTKEDIIIFDLKRELIVIGDISKKIIEGFDTFPKIDEESYIDFQNVIRMAIGKELYEPLDPDMLSQIRRIKAMTRYRERVKGLGSTPLDLMTVLCCMGIGLTPLNVGEITYAAALYLQERHQLKEKYDIDIRVMTSGFGGEKPKDFQHWSLPPKKKK